MKAIAPVDQKSAKAAPASARSTGFYSEELDGLRTLAVGGVMLAHFSPTLGHIAPWGSMGVRLFFVLSGVLITLVLLHARERISAGKSVGGELQQFFIRRIFRLWPLYFASLLLAFGFKVWGTESGMLWHLGFATNFYVFLHQSWPALLSHYWTLAVEQQYYVVWPFIFLMLPGRQLPTLLTITFVAGPLSRALLAARPGANPEYDYVLLSSCLDFFALGSAVAWWQHRGRLENLISARALRLILAASAGWIVWASWRSNRVPLPTYWLVYDGLFQGIGFATLIIYLLRERHGPTARFLRLRPLVYLGQISYGIYIFHNLMHWFAPSLLRRVLGYNYFPSETLHALYLMSLSVGVAAVSYHLFESPLRRLGRRVAGAGQ